MAFLFGGGNAERRDPLQEYQTEVRHACRNLEREDAKIERTDRVLRDSIVRYARLGKLELCRNSTKELVRLRAHRTRLQAMRGHMTSLSQQLSSVQGAAQMQSVMAKSTKLLKGLNTKMDAKAVHKMLCEYERQSGLMQANQEMTEDALDSAFEGDGEAEATDEAMLSVFQELGLDAVKCLPSAAVAARPLVGGIEVEGSVDCELEDRLARIRRI